MECCENERKVFFSLALNLRTKLDFVMKIITAQEEIYKNSFLYTMDDKQV